MTNGFDNLPSYPDYPCTNECPNRGEIHYHGKTKYLKPFIMPPDLAASLDRARAEWKRLEKAGTPYWCTHSGREVSHPKAKSRSDNYDPNSKNYDPIHRKHGVVCTECGGYIQEG